MTNVFNSESYTCMVDGLLFDAHSENNLKKVEYRFYDIKLRDAKDFCRKLFQASLDEMSYHYGFVNKSDFINCKNSEKVILQLSIHTNVWNVVYNLELLNSECLVLTTSRNDTNDYSHVSNSILNFGY